MQNSSNAALSLRAIDRDKSNYWREMIAAWEKSGEHQKQFCARMNIKLGTFSHWRGIFSKETRNIENKFVELKVTKKEREVLSEFIIECPSGHKITFTNQLQADQAEVMFKLLGLIT